MKLYSSPPSYYSSIARLALNESHIDFDTQYMDIHIAKEQLAPWYISINPSMTVPALTEGEQKWTDSRDILAYAAKHSENQWLDYDPTLASKIQSIVDAHYNISIEQLTFGKAMVKHSLLHKVFPFMLKRMIKNLEAEKSVTSDTKAIEHKIDVDKARLAYFTEGDLNKKLNDRREEVREYIRQLPEPQTLLFGDKPSSADVVTTALFARLHMIGETDLIKVSPGLIDWFNRVKTRPAFVKSDVWLRFKPWRILLKY